MRKLPYLLAGLEKTANTYNEYVNMEDRDMITHEFFRLQGYVDAMLHMGYFVMVVHDSGDHPYIRHIDVTLKEKNRLIIPDQYDI